MKRSMLMSVFALFGVLMLSRSAWAHEGVVAYRGGGYRSQAYCAPQPHRGYVVEKRYVQVQRPVYQRPYRREYVAQRAPRWNDRNFVRQDNHVNNVNTNTNNGSNGNHYGWYQNGKVENLTADQQAKAKEFWDKQKSDRKAFMDSLKSQQS